MFIHYPTQGFIIKKIDRGEADQIFTVFTKDFGKLKLLARAVRKIKSKLRGGTKLFSLSEIEFIQGKTHKTLTDAKICKNFDKISKSLIKLKIVYKLAEVVDNLIKEEEKDKDIWDLINEALGKLNSSPPTTYNLMIYYYFFWNLIDLMGFRPSVYNCAFCQKKLTSEPFYFSPEEGGVICKNCYNKVGIKSGERIEPDLVKILRIIFKKSWKTFYRIKVKPTYYKTLKKISDNYYSYLLTELR